MMVNLNMKNKLKYALYSLFNYFNIRRIIYLLTSLFFLNLYCYFDTNYAYTFGFNLIFNLNNFYYITGSILIVAYFVLDYLKRYRDRVELVVRYENRKSYYNYLMKDVVIMTGFIFLINSLMLFVANALPFAFTINFQTYFSYDISNGLYATWLSIRNLIYIFFIISSLAYIEFHFKNKIFGYAFLFSCVGIIYINSHEMFENYFLKVLPFSIYISFYDFSTLLNEIVSFIYSMIIKYYLITFIISMVSYVNKNRKNIKMGFYKIFTNLKKTFLYIIIYIVTNAINVTVLFFQNIDISAKELLCLGDFRTLQYISFATKCISILIFSYVIIKYLSLEEDKNSCLVFTRISRARWLKNKFLLFIIIILMMRSPIYFLAGFDNLCLADFLLYMAITLSIVQVFNKVEKNYLSYYVLIIIAFIVDIDFKVEVILYVLLIVYTLIDKTILKGINN